MINFFNNKYPYTDFHELNLDWLLESYQEIVDNIQALIDWKQTHMTEYAEAMARLQAVENEIDTFEQRIEAEFEQLQQDQQEAFDKLVADTQIELDTLKAQMRAEMQAMKNEFELLKRELHQELLNLKVFLNQEIARIYNAVTANNEYIMQYVEDTLQYFMDHFVHIFTVWNPVRGKRTGLQTAIDDLYDFARYYALTAFQYDSLGLTASEYDAHELTAIEYDQRGYILLGYPDENWYMISPFTGQYTKVKTVVYELSELHKNNLTATEYDALELDADTYDAYELSAYDYDWNGKALLTA